MLATRFRALVAAGGLCAATIIGSPAMTASAAHPVGLDGATGTSATAIAHAARTAATSQPANSCSQLDVRCQLQQTNNAAIYCAKNLCSPPCVSAAWSCPPVGVPVVEPPVPLKHVVFNMAANPGGTAGHLVTIIPPQVSSTNSCSLGVAAVGGLVSLCAKESGNVRSPQNFNHDPSPGGGGLIPGSGCGEAGCAGNADGFPEDSVWSRIADGSYWQYFMRPVEGQGSATHFNLETQWQSGGGIYRNYHIRYYGYGEDENGNPSYWFQSGESQMNQTTDIFVEDNGQSIEDITSEAASRILATGSQSTPGVLDATGDSNMFGEFFQQAAGDVEDVMTQLGNLMSECSCE